MKIAVIGGGSSYTPELIEGFINRKSSLKVDEIFLVDIPSGAKKLNTVGALARRMIEREGLSTKIVLTLNAKEAIKNADFILTQLRVGGLEARAVDEKIPLKYDLIGQETTGAGGFSKALRTIPVMLEIAHLIEQHAKKDAWLINFTNPAGIITEMLLKHTNVNAIGLCNVPIAMEKDVAEIMEVDSERISIDFAGLNHLVYGKKIYCDGTDITHHLLTKVKQGASNSMNNIPDLGWDPELIESLKMLPCPYHRYFYMTEELLLEEQDKELTRSEEVMEIEKELFEVYKNPELDEKPKILEERGGAYYSEVAVSLIDALCNNLKTIHTVNIMNNGAISNLPNDIVVEVNAIVGKDGPKPIGIGKLSMEAVGLVHQVKIYELLTIQAAISGSQMKAIQALYHNPLVNSFEKAKHLWRDILKANKEYLLTFVKK